MNLAVGAVLLSVMLLGTAYAAESVAGKQQRSASPRHERIRLPVAERRTQPAAAEVEAVKTVPVLDERKPDGFQNPVEPMEHTVQLKGVRG